jgi:transposase
VRHSGLNITVYSSDTTRARGRLSRQGPAVLRWALYEAAMRAGNPQSPDHAHHSAIKNRSAPNGHHLRRRKLVRRCHHALRRLGDQVWTPASLN